MDNFSDLYADSTLVGVFLLLGINPLVDGDTDLLVATKFPDAVYQ
jgi:hypothetical protein